MEMMELGMYILQRLNELTAKKSNCFAGLLFFINLGQTNLFT